MSNTNARALRVGIVGLGLAGGLMVPAIDSHPDVILAAAAEPHEALRRRFVEERQVPAFEDIDSLLNHVDLDAVYIATPHQFHRDHAIRAARRGKHILVEKPMALTIEDCDAMIAAASDAGVALVIGHTHSFDPAVLKMHEVIRSGKVGRAVAITHLNYTDFLYRPRRAEELDTARGGGIFFNQIPHQVDVALLLADSELVSVRAAATVLDPDRPTEGGCNAFLAFASGASAVLTYSGYDRFDSDELHGWIAEGGSSKTPAHGRARRELKALGGGEAERIARRDRMGYGSAIGARTPQHQPHFGTLIVSCEGADLRPSADGLWCYDADGATEIALPERSWRPGRGDALDEMIRAALSGERPIHDGHFGRTTVAASLALLRSANEGREVGLAEFVGQGA